jgi:hypothetical protein
MPDNSCQVVTDMGVHYEVGCLPKPAIEASGIVTTPLRPERIEC